MTTTRNAPALIAATLLMLGAIATPAAADFISDADPVARATRPSRAGGMTFAEILLDLPVTVINRRTPLATHHVVAGDVNRTSRHRDPLDVVMSRMTAIDSTIPTALRLDDEVSTDAASLIDCVHVDRDARFALDLAALSTVLTTGTITNDEHGLLPGVVLVNTSSQP